MKSSTLRRFTRFAVLPASPRTFLINTRRRWRSPQVIRSTGMRAGLIVAGFAICDIDSHSTATSD